MPGYPSHPDVYLFVRSRNETLGRPFHFLGCPRLSFPFHCSAYARSKHSSRPHCDNVFSFWRGDLPDRAHLTVLRCASYLGQAIHCLGYTEVYPVVELAAHQRMIPGFQQSLISLLFFLCSSHTFMGSQLSFWSPINFLLLYVFIFGPPRFFFVFLKGYFCTCGCTFVGIKCDN